VHRCDPAGPPAATHAGSAVTALGPATEHVTGEPATIGVAKVLVIDM
jgi:hypothetical protein